MTTPQFDANAFLMGGGGSGAPSAKFTTPGDTVTGVIVDKPTVRQQTEFGTNKPLTWDDGNPKMQMVVKLKTAQRDPLDADDDGVRAIYVKGKMQYAVRDAVVAAGASGLEVGGTLTVTFTGMDGQAKAYSATYAAPTSNPTADAFLNTPAAPAATNSHIDAIIAQLPPDQQAAARAALATTP